MKKQYKGQLAHFFTDILCQKNKIVNECLNKKKIIEQKAMNNLKLIKDQNKKSPNVGLIEDLFDPINRRINNSKIY